MPIVKLPNGQYANVAEGADLSRIKAATPKPQVSKPVSPAQRRADKQIARFGSGGFTDAMKSGLTLGFDDEIAGGVSALTTGVANALRSGNASDIKNQYRVARDAERLVKANRANTSPVSNAIGDIAGSLANPIGSGLGVAAKLAPKAAPIIAKAGGKTKALLTGINQGIASGIGNSEQDVGASAVNGGAGGAIATAVFGGLGRAGIQAAKALGDTSLGAASRVAYGKIANALAGTSRPKGNLKYTPEAAAREIRATDAAGGDASLLDLSPALRAQAGSISRRPSIASSDDLINRGENRLLKRNNRFRDKIENTVNPTTGQNAAALTNSISAKRKAAGDRDYGPALDKQFKYNDDIEEFVTKAPTVTRKAFGAAAELVRAERKDPTQLGFTFNDAGDVVYIKVPNMRTMDYVKRGFDTLIGKSLKDGDRNTARILSGELNNLKEAISKTNPEYADVLKTQRDFYQQQEAVDLGLDALKKLKSDPRALLVDIKALTKDQKDNFQTGVIDAIRNISITNKSANPSAILKSFMVSPEQREAMTTILGGRKNLNKIDRFLTREARTLKGDALVSSGGQSETSRLLMADDAAPSDLKDLGIAGMRGQAFGGLLGSSSAIIRGIDGIKAKISPNAQNELGKLLAGKGEGLIEGVRAARDFEARRLRSTDAKTKAIAKIVANLAAKTTANTENTDAVQ